MYYVVFLNYRLRSNIKQANPRYVQSSSKVFQQEAPKNTPSAGVKTQALAKYRTLTQTLVRPRAVRSTNKHEQTSSLEAKVRQKTPRADVKQIDAADLSITGVYMGLSILIQLKLTAW